MRRIGNKLMVVAAMLAPLGIGGCLPFGVAPLSMGIFTPVPVQPWVTERMEDKYTHKNDFRTPVMPPIKDGFPPPICEDPPDEAMILRAMPRVARGVPYVYEEFRDDIQIVTERLVDKIDPPRFYPLVGPAQLHHCHWKCTVYYTGTVESGYPFPVRVKRPRVEVVYIDRDHLHLCAGHDQAKQKVFTQETSGY